MKQTLYILTLFLSISMFANNVNNDTIKKIKTIKTDILSFGKVQISPSDESLEIKNFDKKDVELINYSFEYFKVKSKDNKTGYVKSIYINLDIILKYAPILEENDIKKAKELKNNMLIRGISVDNINSADGVSIAIDYGYFDKTKTIKYLYFTFVPYNNVGDIQKCDITGKSTFIGKVTGPINAEDKFDLALWENAWYNNTITCAKITKVELQYTDGTKYTYIKELDKIIDSEFENNCKF